MAKIDRNSEDEVYLGSYERGEWHSVSNLREEVARYRDYASAELERQSLVYLKLPPEDLNLLKARATQAGIPYLTLLAQIVHQYVAQDK